MNNQLLSLKVSDNQRFLVKEDGNSFFWLGDTAWELFHKLSREEADLYLSNRAERKFNVIQAVALAEHAGVTTGNAYGRIPLLQNSEGLYDPTIPDVTGEYHYWDHVDYIVNQAMQLGLYIGFLPTWGDKFNKRWGKGPEIFTAENARVYGRWLGNRYKDQKNIIWILGGDRPLDTRLHFAIIHAMAEGLREGDGGRHLITFHPNGGASSAQALHHEDWLDMNMIQSGHGPVKDNYTMIAKDYDRLPVKPIMDGEPCYEDLPISFKLDTGFFDELDVRRAAYWNVFAGGFGHTYGHHCVWSMNTNANAGMLMHWKDAIVRPGSAQMQYVRKLVESRNFLEHVPDQSLIVDNYGGANHMQANRCDDCALIYTPSGIKIKVQMGKITGETVKGYWYDPRSGISQYIGDFDNNGEVVFTPPSCGRGYDWVLILEDAASNYPII